VRQVVKGREQLLLSVGKRSDGGVHVVCLLLKHGFLPVLWVGRNVLETLAEFVHGFFRDDSAKTIGIMELIASWGLPDLTPNNAVDGCGQVLFVLGLFAS